MSSTRLRLPILSLKINMEILSKKKNFKYKIEWMYHNLLQSIIGWIIFILWTPLRYQNKNCLLWKVKMVVNGGNFFQISYSMINKFWSQLEQIGQSKRLIISSYMAKLDLKSLDLWPDNSTCLVTNIHFATSTYASYILISLLI